MRNSLSKQATRRFPSVENITSWFRFPSIAKRGRNCFLSTAIWCIYILTFLISIVLPKKYSPVAREKDVIRNRKAEFAIVTGLSVTGLYELCGPILVDSSGRLKDTSILTKENWFRGTDQFCIWKQWHACMVLLIVICRSKTTTATTIKIPLSRVLYDSPYW